jgi:hypothetical protein
MASESDDNAQPWYHGSDQILTSLRAGSSITQNRDLARAFSHKPSLLGQSDDGRLQHNGELPGYLYLVDEALTEKDVYPHPHPVNVGHWEWLTKREVVVRLLERTEVRDEERFVVEQIAAIRQRQVELGVSSFADDHNPADQSDSTSSNS